MAIYASTSVAGYGTPSGSSPLPQAAKVIGVSGTTFCVCGWFKFPNVGSGLTQDVICLVGRDAAGVRNEFQCVLDASSGQFSFFFRPGGFPNPSITLATTPRYDDSRWHWYAFRKVGDADYRGYIDSPSPFQVSTTSITTAPASGNTYISLFNNNGTQADQGNIVGPCWMFNRDLDISTLIQILHGRVNSTLYSPNNYYPCEDLNGTDASGNGYRLTNLVSIALNLDDPMLRVRALRRGTKVVTGVGVVS